MVSGLWGFYLVYFVLLRVQQEARDKRALSKKVGSRDELKVVFSKTTDTCDSLLHESALNSGRILISMPWPLPTCKTPQF